MSIIYIFDHFKFFLNHFKILFLIILFCFTFSNNFSNFFIIFKFFLKKIRLRNLQAIGLFISDDYLLNYNISRIPTNDIPERINQFTLSFQKLILMSTFSDFIAPLFAKMIGPNGICYNFNTIGANELYKNLEDASRMSGRGGGYFVVLCDRPTLDK